MVKNYTHNEMADTLTDAALAEDVLANPALTDTAFKESEAAPSWDENLNNSDAAEQIEAKIKEARRAASARDLDSANNLFEDARLLASQSTTGPSELNILNEWGRLNLDSQNYKKAETVFKLALKRTYAILGAGTMLAAQQHNALGGLYWTLGKYEDCFEHYQTVFKTLFEICGYFHPDTIEVMGKLGAVSLQLDLNVGAESILNRAVSVVVQIHGDHSPLLPHMLNTLAMVQERLGFDDKAEHCYEWALTILNDTRPGEHNIGVEDINIIQDNLKELRERLSSENS